MLENPHQVSFKMRVCIVTRGQDEGGLFVESIAKGEGPVSSISDYSLQVLRYSHEGWRNKGWET